MGDSTQKSKDQKSRGKQKTCMERTADLVHMILGDESFLKMNWNKRINSLTLVKDKLKDPQFVKEWLTLLQSRENTSSSCDVNKAEPSSQDILSFLPQSNKTAMNLDFANEIHELHPDSNQLNQIGVLQIEANLEKLLYIAEALQKAKEDSQSFNEELNQISAALERKDQEVKDLSVFISFAKMIQKVVDYCSNMLADDILNQGSSNQVNCDREEGQLTLNFPPTPVHNQQTICEDQQSKEVTLTIRSVKGRLAGLVLANPDMLFHRLKNEDFGFSFPEELLDNIFPFQNNEDSNDNASVLREILAKQPDTAKKFLITDPDIQSYFLNLLAELYQKIISEDVILNLEDMESKIRDMEHNGLQLSWLKEMLAGYREERRLLEQIDNKKDAIKEEEQQVAMLRKKRRLQ